MPALQRFVVASRYVVLLTVSCIAVAAVVVLLYGTALTVDLAARAIRQGVGAATTKTLLLDVIELVDGCDRMMLPQAARSLGWWVVT